MASTVSWDDGPLGSHWFMLFGHVPLRILKQVEKKPKKYPNRKRETEILGLLLLLNNQ